MTKEQDFKAKEKVVNLLDNIDLESLAFSFKLKVCEEKYNRNKFANAIIIRYKLTNLLKKLTVKQLKLVASQLNIKGFSGLDKSNLIKLVKDFFKNSFFEKSNVQINTEKVKKFEKNIVTIAKSLNSSNVFEFLSNTKFLFSEFGDIRETGFNKYLYKVLKSKFKGTVSQQYTLAGGLNFKIDLHLEDANRNEIGVEIKMADELLKYQEVQRMLGQIVVYTNDRYTKNNLVLIIIVKRKSEQIDDRIETIVEYLKKFNVKIIVSELK